MIGALCHNKAAQCAFAAAVAACMLASPARADSEIADAQAAIVTRGEFFKVEDLHFGMVIPSAVAGTVTVAPTGTRSATGGVTLVGNIHHAAEFGGRRPGNSNNPLSISVASNSIQLTGPGAPMTVSLFRGNVNPNQVLSTVPRNFQVTGQSNGAFELRVGATLNVNANQAPGTYSGTWSITVDFQ